MINKIMESAEEAVADIKDGSIVLIGGFGMTFVQGLVQLSEPSAK